MDDIDIILLEAENKKLRKENEELKKIIENSVSVDEVAEIVNDDLGSKYIRDIFTTR